MHEEKLRKFTETRAATARTLSTDFFASKYTVVETGGILESEYTDMCVYTEYTRVYSSTCIIRIEIENE
jgi:hypothetical protein